MPLASHEVNVRARHRGPQGTTTLAFTKPHRLLARAESAPDRRGCVMTAATGQPGAGVATRSAISMPAESCSAAFDHDVVARARPRAERRDDDHLASEIDRRQRRRRNERPVDARPRARASRASREPRRASDRRRPCTSRTPSRRRAGERRETGAALGRSAAPARPRFDIRSPPADGGDDRAAHHPGWLSSERRSAASARAARSECRGRARSSEMNADDRQHDEQVAAGGDRGRSPRLHVEREAQQPDGLPRLERLLVRAPRRR